MEAALRDCHVPVAAVRAKLGWTAATQLSPLHFR
jgi:hypothetical protein